MQQANECRVHRYVIAVNLLIAVERAQHVSHKEVFFVIILESVDFFFGRFSLLSERLAEVVVVVVFECGLAEEALLHAAGVLDLGVDERPQLVLQLFNVDLLLNLHQV